MIVTMAARMEQNRSYREKVLGSSSTRRQRSKRNCSCSSEKKKLRITLRTGDRLIILQHGETEQQDLEIIAKLYEREGGVQRRANRAVGKDLVSQFGMRLQQQVHVDRSFRSIAYDERKKRIKP